MNSKEIVLNNGMKVVMINTNKFKTVNVGIVFEDELSDKNITCDNLLVKLLTTKTNKHPSIKEFKDYLKDLYGTSISCVNNLMGETFSFCLYSNCINKKFALHKENLLEMQFQVLNEVLENTIYSDEKYFKEMKNDYRLNLLDKNNYKEYAILKEANKALGKDNKLIVMGEGYLSELDKITINDVSKKYNDLKEMATKIVVVGEFDEDEVLEYIDKYLSFSMSRAKHNYYCINEQKKYDDLVVDSKFSQSSIACIYDLDIRIGDELYYPALLFVELFNYYLFKIVREEYNFCYSIYTIYYGSKGLCLLQSNIEEKNYAKTLEVIDEILNDLRNKIDDKVLKICKDKIISKLEKGEDNPLKIMSSNYIDNIYELGSVSEQISNVNNVNRESIMQVAKMLNKKFNIILKEGK